jgi:nitrate/nitrite transporter NarK
MTGTHRTTTSRTTGYHAGRAGRFAFTGQHMSNKATRIELLTFSTPQMRAFHLTWMAFFVCFFAWFACAPLMPVIKGELKLSAAQIANINIAAVAGTILVRLLVGPLCDRFGPRKTYTALLAVGALPVFGVTFAHSYESFMLMRFLIGAIGTSFVITQYHTSIMFAPNVVGTVNAAAAGWGNAGGGTAQAAMPLILAAVLTIGAGHASAWLLFVFLVGEGLGLLWFAHAGTAALAVVAMLIFGLCTHMACGATYALVPFIDRRAWRRGWNHRRGRQRRRGRGRLPHEGCGQRAADAHRARRLRCGFGNMRNRGALHARTHPPAVARHRRARRQPDRQVRRSRK